jgi:hypothetical protein
MVAYCDATPARLQLRTRAWSAQNGAPVAACPLMGQVVRAEAKVSVPISACLQSHVETRNPIMASCKYEGEAVCNGACAHPVLHLGFQLTRDNGASADSEPCSALFGCMYHRHVFRPARLDS